MLGTGIDSFICHEYSIRKVNGRLRSTNFYFIGISLNTQINQFYISFHLIQPERGVGKLNYISFKSSHLVACLGHLFHTVGGCLVMENLPQV